MPPEVVHRVNPAEAVLLKPGEYLEYTMTPETEDRPAKELSFVRGDQVFIPPTSDDTAPEFRWYLGAPPPAPSNPPDAIGYFAVRGPAGAHDEYTLRMTFGHCMVYRLEIVHLPIGTVVRDSTYTSREIGNEQRVTLDVWTV